MGRADSGEPKEPRIRCESRSSIERGQFGWFFRPIQKYGKLLLRTQHQKINNGVSLRCTKWIIPSSITVCSERNHSVFSNGTTCDVRYALSSKFLAYHRLRGSASPVLTATGFVNGKGQFSTPHRIDTPQPITKKFVTGD